MLSDRSCSCSSMTWMSPIGFMPNSKMRKGGGLAVVNRKPNGSLATLRASTGPDVRVRDEAGQVWRIAEELGTLDRPVRVARTTSRDSGVDASAEVVVATASLEVGFDDPSVGAVIQHKAPRDPASFIQRRGRAGRNPTMRPWTVVVLSDFGRDRLAFQSYETLFDPVVPRVALPLRNRSILKMQATWWLLDRLSRSGPGTSLADVIQKPWGKLAETHNATTPSDFCTHVREQLNANAIERMGQQLQRAFRYQTRTCELCCGTTPEGSFRQCFLHSSGAWRWRRRQLPLTAGLAAAAWRSFFRPALFSPLQTPEIEVTTPSQRRESELEPVSQGLRLYAPGRVSYRYAHRGRR